MKFSKDLINIDAEAEIERISTKLKSTIGKKFRKRGAVIGISGGLDSSVVLALCVKAFGNRKVLAVMMSEKESSVDNLTLSQKLIEKFNVESVLEDITPALTGLGCYDRRDQAIKRIFPEFGNNYKTKIILSNDLLETNSLNFFKLQIISPDGETKSERLPLKEYLEIVAASNFKQRTRMSILYYHAELRNYAVIGTPNKNEHEQGFFVKYGDHGADIKPIVHLFKTQVYQLGNSLGIPSEILKRTPTSDTYSAEQSQEEFFFRTPFDILDRVWFGWEKGYSFEEISVVLGISANQVQNIVKDIEQKQRSSEFLKQEPVVFYV